MKSNEVFQLFLEAYRVGNLQADVTFGTADDRDRHRLTVYKLGRAITHAGHVIDTFEGDVTHPLFPQISNVSPGTFLQNAVIAKAKQVGLVDPNATHEGSSNFVHRYLRASDSFNDSHFKQLDDAHSRAIGVYNRLNTPEGMKLGSPAQKEYQREKPRNPFLFDLNTQTSLQNQIKDHLELIGTKPPSERIKDIRSALAMN